LADYQHITSLSNLYRLYNAFLDQEDLGFDGVILKALSSSYFANAIKIKKEMTVDAVVIGAYVAKGERVSSLLLAVFDNPTKLWVPIGKIRGDGAKWDAVCNACLGLAATSPKELMNVVSPPESPSIWIMPNIVVQVTARQISPGAKGAYLLFVEAMRDAFIRWDKDVNTATTFAQLMEIAGIETRPPISPNLFNPDKQK
jgi:ATP-dependent DNA ligase